MMRKTCKAIFAAGLLASLLTFQTAYGASPIANGATMIIRVNENGQTQRENLENGTSGEGQAANGGAGSLTGTDTSAGAAASGDQTAAGTDAGAVVSGDQTSTGADTAADLTQAGTAADPTQPNVAADPTQAGAMTDPNASPDGTLPEGQAGELTEPLPETAQPVPQLPAGIRALDPTKPMIALTFDDGPYAPVGNRIMDVMNQYGGKCTFFMVGNRVPSYTAEVQRMVNEGFEVANHTQDHKYLNQLGADSIRAQVEACNNTIQAVTGVRPTLMRLPGGNKNSTVLANVNMPIILWNMDTKDWKNRNAQSVINAVMGKVKDGDIVLMHELYTSTAEAVEALVPALTAQGFQLVTVSELAYYKGLPLNPGQIYNSIP